MNQSDPKAGKKSDKTDQQHEESGRPEFKSQPRRLAAVRSVARDLISLSLHVLTATQAD